LTYGAFIAAVDKLNADLTDGVAVVLIVTASGYLREEKVKLDLLSY
jgi:hypothetical protein